MHHTAKANTTPRHATTIPSRAAADIRLPPSIHAPLPTLNLYQYKPDFFHPISGGSMDLPNGIRARLSPRRAASRRGGKIAQARTIEQD
jgi:hypothetical protein